MNYWPWFGTAELARRFTIAACGACKGTKYASHGPGPCDRCEGTGREPKPESALCTACRGLGTGCAACLCTGRPHVPCTRCRANGAIGGRVCPDCEGRRALDVVSDASVIDVHRQRAAERAAGVAPSSAPARLGAPVVDRDVKPSNVSQSGPGTGARVGPSRPLKTRAPVRASEPPVVESVLVRDEVADAAAREAWRAAEGPQHGARSKKSRAA